jgi:site-specific recombinase XerD
MKRDDVLPPYALEYLGGARSARQTIRSFHVWLKRSGRPFLKLEAAEVEGFLMALPPPATPRLRRRDRRRLVAYLTWFHERHPLTFEPKSLLPQRHPELPPEAVHFTKSLEPTVKPATVAQHRSAVRNFYAWLDSRTLTVEMLDRSSVSLWFQSIHARGLQPASRIHLIQSVRGYFRWLEERADYGGLSADHLFRPSDFPKLPRYLPRPIPADVDRVLQRRLGKSKCLLQFGLLLMRRTGLRIGELRGLAFHCLRVDPHGNTFLKVPLGKLATERLVPLDRVTLRLIHRIRVHGSTGKRGKRRTLLLERDGRGRIPYVHLVEALKRAAKGLVLAEPLTSHRLRHTYATSMLAGGMSIPSLMKLLGHVDYRMTLRYAAISDETVGAEHAAATDRIEQRYKLKPPAAVQAGGLPTRALADLARLLLKTVDDEGRDKLQARALVRRIQRLDTAVQRLMRNRSQRATRSD